MATGWPPVAADERQPVARLYVYFPITLKSTATRHISVVSYCHYLCLGMATWPLMATDGWPAVVG